MKGPAIINYVLSFVAHYYLQHDPLLLYTRVNQHEGIMERADKSSHGMMEVVYVYVSASGVKSDAIKVHNDGPYLGTNKESPGVYSPLLEV